MATAAQIKSLVKSHTDKDDKRFYSTALQIAAAEMRQGHTNLAEDLKGMVDKSRQNHPDLSSVNGSKISHFEKKDDLNGLLSISYPAVRINEMILSEDINSRFKKVILEQKEKEKLARFGLSPRRKLLFTGCPGTGKTMSALMLATELKLPLYTVVLDNLITRYMGETAAKLRLIFDRIQETRAIYFFDEFDSIGTQRGASNDVGEIRRVLNSFLVFVEQDRSDSIILAATNHPELLDKALYRRFDDIVNFEKPNEDQIIEITKNKLALFNPKRINWKRVSNSGLGLSAAEIVRACEDAAKESVLDEKNLTTSVIINAFERRK